MNKQLKLKIHESLAAVLPVSLIVLALCAFVVPVDLATLCLFLAGAALLIVGMGFFSLGVDMAMMPIGELVGTRLTRTRKLWLILAGCFLIGVLVTMAEPDLTVLASQTPAVPDMVLILTVAAGVGLFLVLSFLLTISSRSRRKRGRSRCSAWRALCRRGSCRWPSTPAG